MERVVVVGCSGSGKTTLACSLAGVLDAPHIELDSIFHQEDWTPLGVDEFRSRVDRATRATRWVVDGNYSAVQDIVWGRADTVIWFDLPWVTVMARMVRRTLWRVATRQELWNGNREQVSNLWSLDPEQSMIVWTATRHKTYRRRYRDAAADPVWARLRFVRLSSQRETNGFVAGVGAAALKEE